MIQLTSLKESQLPRATGQDPDTQSACSLLVVLKEKIAIKLTSEIKTSIEPLPKAGVCTNGSLLFRGRKNTFYATIEHSIWHEETYLTFHFHAKGMLGFLISAKGEIW